jgi:hypothetical protein
MLYADPKTYGYTDIAEDLPGAARAVAPLVRNVLPSQAIISRDPEVRKKQIEEAALRIAEAKKAKKGIGHEMWANVKHMTPEALKAGTMLGALIPLLGLRNPILRNSAGKFSLRSPSRLLGSLKALVRRPSYAKHIGMHALEGGLFSSAHAALGGAAIPLLANNVDISKDSLEDAKHILQEQPQITSLPTAEILSAAQDGNDPKDRLRRGLVGAGIGAISAIPHSVFPAGISASGMLAKNVGKNLGTLAKSILARGGTKNMIPVGAGVRDAFISQTKKNFPTALKWGIGLGGLGGALVDTLPDEQQQNINADQV